MMRVAFLVIVGLAFSTVVLAQESSIWIEPGVGVGHIKLGDSTEQLKQKLGRPNKMSGNSVSADLDYPHLHISLSGVNSMMRLIKSAKEGEKVENPKIEPIVDSITTYDSSAKTRGGLTIGSSLKDVLEIFGDLNVRTENRSGGEMAIVKCA